MIPELGHFSLILALLLALSLGMIPWFSFFTVQQRMQFTYSLTLSTTFFIVLSFMSLLICFVDNDFSVLYVAQNSNSHLPLIYRICAIWGAHEGSLLLWSLILSLWTVSFAMFSAQVPMPIKVKVLGVLAAIQVGFLLMILQTSDPFIRLLPFSPTEGADLNPLLQDPAFILHPPFLYLGYVGFAVPFAFAMAECLQKRDQHLPWVQWIRSWALCAVGFLSIGIALGSWWAYYELGWGGWWFWDPVENASFMPWLVGIAFIHALWVSQHQPIFKAWRLFLAIFAFLLSLIGTFLVRSGILSSVHAFATDASRGTFILVFISLVMLSAFALFFHALKDHKVVTRFQWFSKEALILLGNVLLVVATLTVMLGTLYPLVTEILWQQKISVGPPYFNSVFVPITLPLLLLMSMAVHVNVQQDQPKRMIRAFKYWGLGLLVLMCFFGWVFGRQLSIGSWIGILFASILMISTVARILKKSLRSSVGFILGHLGIASLVMGISLLTSLQIEKEMTVTIGETASIADLQLRFDDLISIQGSNYEAQRGRFTILRHGQPLAELRPEKRFYTARDLLMTETDIHTHGLTDFYLALGEPFDNDRWSIRFYIKPYIRLIWLGGLLIALGAFSSAMRMFRWNKAQIDEGKDAIRIS